MPEVQKIACVNEGAFVMRFDVEVDGQLRTSDTGNYPAGQTRVIDLGPLSDVKDGAALRPVVDVEGGKHDVKGGEVRFKENGATATFEVKGTTLHPKIEPVG
ncbi:MAG TPA: hypothetical protein VF712_10805 [Thermoleophilaceae bacterium]|jgi:hypothetical protein